MDSGTPKPLTGNTPYEILGVAEDDPNYKIKSQKERLVEKYQKKAREAKQEHDNQKFKEANEALNAIDSAYEWITGEDSDFDENKYSLKSPYDILRVDETDSLSEIKAQRDLLLQKYRQKITNTDIDQWEFREAVRTIDRIESAWEWIRSQHRTNQD